MIIFVLICGAIAIIAVSALLAFITAKIWLAIIKSNEKADKKAIQNTKKDGYRFLFGLLMKDYDTEKRDAIICVIVLFALLCACILFFWFSAGLSHL